MMADSMSRSRSGETITTEYVRELREKLLDFRRSGEEQCTEPRLLETVHAPPLDVDKKVEMFYKISPEERNRYWSKLKGPSLYLGTGTARKL